MAVVVIVVVAAVAVVAVAVAVAVVVAVGGGGVCVLVFFFIIFIVWSLCLWLSFRIQCVVADLVDPRFDHVPSSLNKIVLVVVCSCCYGLLCFLIAY